jgi:uncharacterized protein (DUF305 family)
MKIVGAIVAAIVAFVIGRATATPPATPAPSMDHGSMNMEHAMMSMSDGLEGKEGDAFDRAFVTQMILHHEGAVEMAEMALEHAQREEVKALSREIIKAQTTEIQLMHSWQQAWQ